MKTVAICRLRSKVNFVEPGEHIMDSFYFLLREFIKNHPEYNYTYYNFAFGAKPVRDVDAIKKADIILIPTENEFHAWVPNYLHPLNLQKCNEKIDLIKPHIHNKKVVLLCNDRADTPQLYRERTFAGLNVDIDILDEDDFPQGIHVMKHYINTAWLHKNFEYFDWDYVNKKFPKKQYDFCYWGTDKRKLAGGANSGDERHTVLKAIRKQTDLDTAYIGRFYNITRDDGMLPMKKLYPLLVKSGTSLCFNWLSDTAITARYHETFSSGFAIPLVWKNYDINNRVVVDQWQRCFSIDEALDKIRYKKANPNYHAGLWKKWVERLPSYEDTAKLFEKLLLEKLR